jgi:hypothetical protein
VETGGCDEIFGGGEVRESITETDDGDITLTTSIGIYDASIQDGDLIFHAHYLMDNDFADKALKRAANSDVTLSTCVDFTALDLFGAVKACFAGMNECEEQDALRTPMMILRSHLLDGIKKIDTLLKVSPPHLLQSLDSKPPAADSDRGAR